MNRIFDGKTSRYEYLCMIYDLAHSRSPASRRRVEDIGFVWSSVSTYSNIYRERTRMKVKEKTKKKERKKDTRTVGVLKSKRTNPYGNCCRECHIINALFYIEQPD